MNLYENNSVYELLIINHRWPVGFGDEILKTFYNYNHLFSMNSVKHMTSIIIIHDFHENQNHLWDHFHFQGPKGEGGSMRSQTNMTSMIIIINQPLPSTIPPRQLSLREVKAREIWSSAAAVLPVPRWFSWFSRNLKVGDVQWLCYGI